MADYTISTNAKAESVLDRALSGGTKQQMIQRAVNAWIRSLSDQQDNQDASQIELIRRLASNAAKASAKATLIASIAPPQVTNPGDKSNPVGTVIALQVVATDPDATGLQFAATSLPPGLAINPDSGLISGTLASSSGSPFLSRIRVQKINEINTFVQWFWTVT